MTGPSLDDVRDSSPELYTLLIRKNQYNVLNGEMDKFIAGEATASPAPSRLGLEGNASSLARAFRVLQREMDELMKPTSERITMLLGHQLGFI